MGLDSRQLLQQLWVLACLNLLVQHAPSTTAAPLVTTQASSSTSSTADKSATATNPTAYKWTVFVYMAADNDLECYGMDDMMEMMFGMAAEPPGCLTTYCGDPCPVGTIDMKTVACGTGGQRQSRCCPGAFPDVLLLVDRGAGSGCRLGYLNVMGFNTSLMEKSWSSAKELQLLPGGSWQERRDFGEINMSKSKTIASFLSSGLASFPPDSTRKYMLVFWDHGSGWQGYGVDQTCDAASSYNPNSRCGMLRLQDIAAGLSAGLMDPIANLPMQMDIIGFDACLMGMYEVAVALRPYTKYLLGSEILEPGHGWDYSVLGWIGTAGLAAIANNTSGPTSKNVGQIFIDGFRRQVETERTTGLALALVNLEVLAKLETDMQYATSALSNQLKLDNSQAIRVLQQRAKLFKIAGAEDNVDLGSTLLHLTKAAVDSNTLASLESAYNTYRQAISVYTRDMDLPDGTGLAVYFPVSSTAFDSDYSALAGAHLPISKWTSFLRQLYESTTLAVANKGQFAFEEAYAVPFWSQSLKSWITYGTLTSDTGLSSTLMYGFASPDGLSLMMAGSMQAAVMSTRAVGAWSGHIYAVVQKLGGQQRLALAHAEETRSLNSLNRTEQLQLQIKVYYAPTCSSPTSSLRKGLLRYVYNRTTDVYNLQLFVTTADDTSTGSWGEVPPQQGGVIIPYLVKIPVKASTSNVPTSQASTGISSASFGFADCLKWGYNGTMDIGVVGVEKAAAYLGLDLAEDVITQLVVQSVDGSSAGLTGIFAPTQKTRAGCQCKQRWVYSPGGGKEPQTVQGVCINPDHNANGAYCAYEPDSCTNPGGREPASNTTYLDYCDPVVTLSGCKCHQDWTTEGKTYYGTCHKDTDPVDPRGSWCLLDKSSCPGNYRAHQYGAGNLFQGLASTKRFTGLDWDFCQTRTQHGCLCSTSWTYGGVTMNGRCMKGLPSGKVTSLIGTDTFWCIVDPTSCRWPQHLDGFPVDTCTPEVGRVATTGVPCKLPSQYHNITLYDCVAYNHSALGSVVDPWCFINSTDGSQGVCSNLTCSQGIKQRCPNGSPAAASSLDGWSTSSCIFSLCYSRQDLVNISRCTNDTAAELELLDGTYGYLNSSSDFSVLLGEAPTEGGLDSYCSHKYGQLCVDEILDPACPALSRSDNTWIIATNRARLCDIGCLKALCTLATRSAFGYSGTGSLKCVDLELELYIRWDLMEQMGKTCNWGSPPRLMCNKLLASQPICVGSTVLTNTTGEITTMAPSGGNYSAGSDCSWTINMPDSPYISLSFKAFDTEYLYDPVIVEDLDGVVGIFSGPQLPDKIETDTGLLKVSFTSDDSIEGAGFTATYIADSSPELQLPNCMGSKQLLQVVLRTRQYGGEVSWVLSQKTNAKGQLTFVAAGGALPPKVQVALPAEARNNTDAYKDYRSYNAYSCVSPGSYLLTLYDSYGDGWAGATIVVTQLTNGDATMGCELLKGTLASSGKNYTFGVQANASSDSSTCSAMTLNDLGYYFQAQLALSGEDIHSFNLAKQRKLKGALAQILDVDVSDISILGISNLTTNASATSSNNTISASGSSNAAVRASTLSGGNTSLPTEGEQPPEGQESVSGTLAGTEATDTSEDAAGADDGSADHQEGNSTTADASTSDSRDGGEGILRGTKSRPAAAGTVYDSWEGAAAEGKGDFAVPDVVDHDAQSQLPQKGPGYRSSGPVAQSVPTPVPDDATKSGPEGQPRNQAGAPPSRRLKALPEANTYVAAAAGGGGADEPAKPAPSSVAELLLAEGNQLAAAKGRGRGGRVGQWQSPLHGLLAEIVLMPEFLAQAVVVGAPSAKAKQQAGVLGEAAGSAEVARECEAGIRSQQLNPASNKDIISSSTTRRQEERTGPLHGTAAQRRLTMLELDEEGNWQQSGVSVDAVTPDIAASVMPTISISNSGNVVIEMNGSALGSPPADTSSSNESPPSSSSGSDELFNFTNNTEGDLGSTSSSPNGAAVTVDPTVSTTIGAGSGLVDGSGVVGGNVSSNNSSSDSDSSTGSTSWVTATQQPIDLGNVDGAVQFGISEGTLDDSNSSDLGVSSDPLTAPAGNGSDTTGSSSNSTDTTGALVAPHSGGGSGAPNISSSGDQNDSAAFESTGNSASGVGVDVTVTNSSSTASPSNGGFGLAGNTTPGVMESQGLGQGMQTSDTIHPALESLLAPPMTFGPMPTGSRGTPSSAAAPKWQPVNLGYSFRTEFTSFVASEESVDVAAVPKPTVVGAVAGPAGGANAPLAGQQLTAEVLQQRLGKAEVYEDPEEGVVHAYTISRGLREANGSSSSALMGAAGAAAGSGAGEADQQQQVMQLADGSTAAAPTRAGKLAARVGLSPFVNMHERRLVKPVMKAFRGAGDGGEGRLHASGPVAAAGAPAANNGVGQGRGDRHRPSLGREQPKTTQPAGLKGGGLEGAAAAQQQQLLLRRPARAPGSRWKRSAEAAAAEHAVAVLKEKRARAWGEQAHQVAGTVPGRTLLQVSNTAANNSSTRNSSVVVVVRVQGYADRDNATAAALAMADMIYNGTLSSALAAKGYPGVTVSVIGSIETGKITTATNKTGLTSSPYLLPLALGVGAGGLAFLLLLVGLVIWFVRRRRRRAAAATASQGGIGSGLQKPLAAYADRASSAGGTGSAASSEGGNASGYQATGQPGGRKPGWSPLGPQQPPPSSGWAGRLPPLDFQPMSAPNSPPVSTGGTGDYHPPDERPSAPPLELQSTYYAGVKSPAYYGDFASTGYGVQQQQQQQNWVPSYPPAPSIQQQQPSSGRSSPALYPAVYPAVNYTRPGSPLGMPSRVAGPDSVPVYSDGQVAFAQGKQGKK